MFYDLGMSPDQLDFFRLLHNVEAPFAALFAARGTSRSTPTARLGAAQRTRMSTAAVLRRPWRLGGRRACGLAGLGVCVRQVPNPCAGTAPPPLTAAKTLQAARRSYCGLGHSVSGLQDLQLYAFKPLAIRDALSKSKCARLSAARAAAHMRR